MGGCSTVAHCGSLMVSQCRKAARRHSSMKSGSFFFSEIRRMTSSEMPRGNVSDRTSVTKLCGYSLRIKSLILDSVELMADLRFQRCGRVVAGLRGETEITRV